MRLSRYSPNLWILVSLASHLCSSAQATTASSSVVEPLKSSDFLERGVCLLRSVTFQLACWNQMVVQERKKDSVRIPTIWVVKVTARDGFMPTVWVWTIESTLYFPREATGSAIDTIVNYSSLRNRILNYHINIFFISKHNV